MNTVQRIAKNTGVLLVSQIASYIIGFFFIMYCTLFRCRRILYRSQITREGMSVKKNKSV